MMNKILTHLFVIIILIGFYSEARASHAAGADIVFEHVSGNTYKVILSFYRDCGGINPSGSYSISYSGCAGSGSFTVSEENIVEVTPLCNSANSECGSGSNYGINRHRYEGEVTLPGNCTDWEFDFCENARNAAIDVISSPGSQDLCVEATLDNQTAPGNNSPVFGSDPVSIICTNFKYCMNFLAIDPDGDSLSYTVITPLKNENGGTVNYLGSYSASNPLETLPGGEFNLDQSGTICFTAANPIITILAVRVDEWRNGVKIGSVIRDIQINVQNCSNAPPELQGYDGNTVDPSGSNITQTYCPGDDIILNIGANDQDAGQNITLELDNSIPDANFVDNGDGTGVFTWVPQNGEEGEYCFFITAKDDNCPYYATNVQEYCLTIEKGVAAGFATYQTICGDMVADLTASGDGNFTWSVESGEPIDVGVNFSCTDCQNPSATPSVSTIYRVTSDIAAGACSNTDTVHVNVVQNLGNMQVDAGPDVEVCFGQCLTIGATASITTGTLTYDWSPTTEMSDASLLQPDICPVGVIDREYTLTIYDQNNCWADDKVRITSVPEMHFDVTITDEDCQLNNGEIQANVLNGSGNYSYSWEDNTNPGVEIANTVALVGQSQGAYSLSIVDSDNGCTADTLIDIAYIDNTPVIDAIPVTDEICDQASDGTADVQVSNGSGTYTFALTPNGNTSGDATGDYTGLAADTYIVDVSDDVTGCIVQGNFVIAQGLVLGFTTVVTNTACGEAKGEIIANATGATSYSYSINGDIALDYQSSNSFPNLPANVYDVWVESSEGCKFNDIVNLNNTPAQTFDPIITAQTSCDGSCDGTAEISLQAGTPNFEFILDGVSMGLNFTSSETLTGLCAGRHNLTTIDQNDCLVSEMFDIISPDPVITSVNSDTTICYMGTAQLSANSIGGNGGFSYTWTEVPGTSLPGTNASNSVSPLVTTSYEVFATDALGCISPPVSVNVNVLDQLSVNAFIDKPIICFGDSISVSSIGSGGDGNYTYTWRDNQGGVFNGQNINDLIYSTDPILTVTLDDGCETPSVDASVTAEVRPLPVVDFVPDTTMGCAPLTVRFTNNSLYSQSCNWDFGDLGSSNTCDPTHTFSQVGCFDVTLTVTSDFGCVDSATQTSLICTDNPPTVLFTENPDVTTVSNTLVEFTNLTENAVGYTWNFGDGGSSNEFEPTYTYPQEVDTFIVELIAISEFACPDTAYGSVIIKNELLFYVPNAFTVEGNGVNELFRPYMTQGVSEEEYEFLVFNRWGEVVYRTNSFEGGWDGHYNGKPAQMDVYIWKLVFKEEGDAIQQEHYGHVTLVR